MPRKFFLTVGIISAALLPASTAFAQVAFDPTSNDPSLTTVNALTYLSAGKDPVTISINIINWALSFLSLVSMIMFLYAGVIWFRSSDNDEEVKKAKDIIIGAIAGFVLTVSAYGISYLIFTQLGNITDQDASTYQQPVQ